MESSGGPDVARRPPVDIHWYRLVKNSGMRVRSSKLIYFGSGVFPEFFIFNPMTQRLVHGKSENCIQNKY